MLWEVLVNYKSGLNLSLYHALNGNLKMSFEVSSLEWALFYPPSVYSFALANAYSKSKQINQQLEAERVSRTFKSSYHTGLFIGLAIGMTLGLIWGASRITPVFSGLAGGIVGGIIGYLAEKIIQKRQVK